MKNYLNGSLIYDDNRKELVFMPCPVCGGSPRVSRFPNPWDEYVAHCPICGFSYSALNKFGKTEEEAAEIWNYNVIKYGLDTISIDEEGNDVDSKYWKEKKEWYSQQNKKKDSE